MPYKPAIGVDPHGKPSVAFWPREGGIIFAVYDAIDELHLCEGPELTRLDVIQMIQRRMEAFQRVPGSRESPRHKIWRHYIAAHGPGLSRRLKGESPDSVSIRHWREINDEWNMMFSKLSHHGPAGLSALRKCRQDERANRLWVSPSSIGGELPTYLADQHGTFYRR